MQTASDKKLYCLFGSLRTCVRDHLDVAVALIVDFHRRPESVAHDDGRFDILLKRDVRFRRILIKKFAAIDRHAAAVGEDAGGIVVDRRPRDEMTRGEADVAAAGNLGDVVGHFLHAPETAGGELHRAGVGGRDFDAAHELAVGECHAGVLLRGIDFHRKRPGV